MKKLLILLVFFFLSNNALAINFSFTDMEGKVQKLSDYKGKWVLVNFWATWCPPCRKEIPDLTDFHQENDDAVVIGVNYEPGISDKKLNHFLALYLVNYPITRVNDEIIATLGEPRGLPTSILIDPQGNVKKKISGMVTDRKLNQMIAQFERQSKKEK
ncbi:TlpA family protein disulfide reductase [sulfur-oxidizing endosymbiont of Gigantopelta aegis]|uniref:TlpA family protein disulfide reductase n=1 Tax=sulfur-oxidizing endosymbiont of Gigantopelta aegis TaxID=2794934 RepID=UPI0018DB6ACD|nr:TlpA disulfide reductase family protein [sulfur-oxidizing endosymbiont of Gigantopelta aegis]